MCAGRRGPETAKTRESAAQLLPGTWRVNISLLVGLINGPKRLVIYKWIDSEPTRVWIIVTVIKSNQLLWTLILQLQFPSGYNPLNIRPELARINRNVRTLGKNHNSLWHYSDKISYFTLQNLPHMCLASFTNILG